MKQAQKINYWKWAFLILLTILLLGSGFLFWQSTRENPILSSTNEESVSSTIPLVVSFDNQGLENLVNTCLDQEETSELQYHFQIKENFQLDIAMQWPLLHQKSVFAVEVQPVVMENGNLKLKIQEVRCGALKHLPTRVLLLLMEKKNILPAWMHINPSQKEIQLDFAHSPLAKYGQIKVETIDLRNQSYRFRVWLNSEERKK